MKAGAKRCGRLTRSGWAIAGLLGLSNPVLVVAESAYRILAAADLPALTGRFEPGDEVILPNATWKDTRLTFRGKGTAEKPIRLRAETPGGFVLTGKSQLVIDGEWLVVTGISVKDGGPDGDGIVLKGRHNRLTMSAMDGGTYQHFVRLYGTQHRIDHCYFARKTSDDALLQVEVDAKEPNHHRIDHNHFGERAPLGRNGGEIMRVGYSYQATYVSRTVVERNLFERCDGEIEIISSKSGENVYRGNTFRNCDGMLTLRHGDRNVVDGNFFFGEGKPNSGGIRIIGEDHVVTNNYIEGVKKGGIWITAGIPNSEPKGYVQANRALVAFNTIVASAGPYLDLSAGLGGAGRTLVSAGVTIANNVFDVGPEGKLWQGMEGEAWTWIGNIVHGTPATRAGVRGLDPKLARAGDGLLRPEETSPLRGQAEGRFPQVTTDIDGDRRAEKSDVGCDHVTRAASARTNRPLTAGDVGPDWLKRR